jgi:4-hydroxy-tetrahydrodipicolinate synthase
MKNIFPVKGILPVLQTPFLQDHNLDWTAHQELIRHALDSGANGFLVPGVASEVEWLHYEEREALIRSTVRLTGGRVPVIGGASADELKDCAAYGTLCLSAGADAFLTAVPQNLYLQSTQEQIRFFRELASSVPLPLIIQDLQFAGPGLHLEMMKELYDSIPSLIGFKVETISAGLKYTALRKQLGGDCFLSGGWAVTQLIEALDRGVDAMIPEASMIPVYRRIFDCHRTGDRDGALKWFRNLLPILAFSNQELYTSIAFFKKLLVRKGIFRTSICRADLFNWDEYNSKIGDELIFDYLELETSCIKS